MMSPILLLCFILLLSLPICSSLAGFGAPSSKAPSKGGKAAPLPPLSPKKQWDNFSKLSKTRPSATVAVRPDPLSPWRAIGVVNTATDATTYPVAVSRQKRLVSEHAVRLFPGLAGKKTLEFGLCEEEGSEKVEIVKLESTSVAWDAVGFEGMPDKATGYYCLYDSGKVVNDKTKMEGGGNSKKAEGGSGWNTN